MVPQGLVAEAICGLLAEAQLEGLKAACPSWEAGTPETLAVRGDVVICPSIVTVTESSVYRPRPSVTRRVNVRAVSADSPPAP